jgi:uncharacterized damage-inducible protein DinB
MNLLEYLQQLYDYHYWAKNHILAAAQTLTDEQLHRPQGHSWGSVHGVLLHMTDAEWIWLQRWQGNSPKTFPDRQDFQTLAAIRQRWAELEAVMRAFLAEQTEQSLQREVSYTNTSGDSFRLILWQMMGHLANHGTHHRGELAAMFAIIGISHAEDDWLYYFLEKSGQWH